MKNYRRAYVVALIGNFLLGAGLLFAWWRFRNPHAAIFSRPVSQQAGPSHGSEATAIIAPASGAGPGAGAPGNTEAPLAPLQLSPQRLQSIGVKTGVVQSRLVQDEIRAFGNVEVNEQGLTSVQIRFPGWIQKVFADSTYQYVRKGQPLFTIYSPDLVATEQEYLLARQNGGLMAQSSVPGVASGAASLVDAAAERLKQWNVPEREISQLQATGKVRQELEIDSPVSGYITDRSALPNMYAQPDTRLYSLADLSTVWVYAQVFQADIGRVKPGDPAIVSVDAYPGRNFPGHVDFIWPQVDMNTRTVRVRLVFPNPDMKLTPGMFVNVRLGVPMGRQTVIPSTGVFQSGLRQVVFVDRGNGNLEPREVQLGPRAGDDFIVLEGLKPGERIVTSANFLIDSESQLQAAMGSFAPPPPGTGAAAAMNVPGGAADIELTTLPSPPHKGANTFQVKLTSKGAPVTGAEVTVSFFMPAMPAMGMASMRVPVALSDKGNGLYEGSGQLESGGTWQVTILAKKNGQLIATKQLSVNATGGM